MRKNIFIFHLLFSLSLMIQCSTAQKAKPESSQKEDRIKESLFKRGDEQRISIFLIQTENREDLLGYLPAILRAKNTESETRSFIIQLYLHYGSKLDTLLPEWKEDLKYVLETSTDPSTLKLILNYSLETRDKRFFYSITELIRHRSREIRLLSYKYLAAIKDDRAIPYLLELTNTGLDLDKYYYLEALQYMKDERTTINLLSLLNHKSHAIRSASIRAIESFQLKDAYHYLSRVAKSDSNYEVRKYAIRSIANLHLKQKAYILKDTIMDKHPEVREESTRAIISFGHSSYSHYISKALSKENFSDLKMLMIDALVELKNDGGAGGLIETLELEKSIEVRARAAYAIGELKSRRGIPQLISSLKNDRIEEVKISVAGALGNLREKSAVPTILDSLNNEHETLDLKLELVTTLDKIDEPKVMPIIFDLIEVEKIQELKRSMKTLLRAMLYRYYKPNYSIAIKEEQVSILSSKKNQF